MEQSMSTTTSLAASSALLAAAATKPQSGNVDPSNFSIEVVDYYLQDDAAYYQNHIFILEIFIEQNEIQLYRSYAAFCELDTKLRRQYPRSSIPTLPLAGASLFQKKHVKRFSILKGSGNNATVATGAANMAPNATALDVRESVISSAIGQEKASAQRMLAKRLDVQELIPNRKPYLTRYLNDLLKIPEVVMSDTFHVFLDDESPMDNQPSHLPEYNEENFQGLEINLLLQEESPTIKTISKEFLFPLGVYQGGVVVWSFETKQHDIGFSIAFDEKEIVAYQRVQSHVKAIQGYFEVPKSGQMTFLWDNTYSKWRSKQMSYIVRIVDKDTFREVLDQATSMVREKLQRHKQRLLVKKVLSSIAHKSMFSAGSNTDLQQRMLQQQQQQSELPQEQHSVAEGQVNEKFPSPTAHHATTNAPPHSKEQSVVNPNDTSAVSSQPPPALVPSTDAVNYYPRMHTSLYGGNASEIIMREESAGDNNTSSSSSTPGAGLLRPSTLFPSAADHEITVMALSQQVDTLKSEKSFLQQALSQAEAALVQERSACASNFQQVEDITMSKEMMEEELQTLQEENETLRKELHDLVQQQQQQERQSLTSSASSKLWSQLAHHGATPSSPSSPSTGSCSASVGTHSIAASNGHGVVDTRRQDARGGGVVDESSTILTETDKTNADSLVGSAASMMHFSSQEMDTMKTFMEMSVEEFLLHYPQQQQQQQQQQQHHQITDNIRQLLSLHHFPGLLTFTRQLLIEKKKLQEQTQQTEQQLLKQKTLSKQLKLAALQLKEQQVQTQALLQQSEHEKHFVISENETLSAKLRSYENQVRLLQKENKEIHEAYRGLYQYVYSTPPAVAVSDVGNNHAFSSSTSESSTIDDAPGKPLEDTHTNGPTDSGAEEKTAKDVASTTNNHHYNHNNNNTNNHGNNHGNSDSAKLHPEVVVDTSTGQSKLASSAASVADRMKQLTQQNWLKRRTAQPPASSEGSSTDAMRDTNAPTGVKSNAPSIRVFPLPTSFLHSSSSSTTQASPFSSSFSSNPTAAQGNGIVPVFLSPAQLQAQFEEDDSTIITTATATITPATTDSRELPKDAPAPAEGDVLDTQKSLSLVGDEESSFVPVIAQDGTKTERAGERSSYLSHLTTSFRTMIRAENRDESLVPLATNPIEGREDTTTPDQQHDDDDDKDDDDEGMTNEEQGHGSNPTSPAAAAAVVVVATNNSPPTTNNRSSFLTSLKQMNFGF